MKLVKLALLSLTVLLWVGLSVSEAKNSRFGGNGGGGGSVSFSSVATRSDVAAATTTASKYVLEGNATAYVYTGSRLLADTTYFQQGDMFYVEGSSFMRRIPANTASDLRYLSQFGGNNPTWQSVAIPSNFTYFLSSTVASGTTYFMSTIEGEVLQSTPIPTVSGPVCISTWITPVGQPGVTTIPAGIWHIHIDAIKNAANTKNLFFFFNVYADDTINARTLLFTSQNSEYCVTTTSNSPQEIEIENSYGDFSITTNTRLVLEVWANTDGGGTGGNPSGKLYYQGATASRLELPATVISSNFLPYSGATQNTDTGRFSIKTSTIIFPDGTIITSSSTLGGGITIAQVVSTTSTWSATQTFSSVTLNNVYVGSSFQGMPCIPVTYSSSSLSAIQNISLTLPSPFDSTEVVFTSSGTSSTSAGYCIYFNDDQSNVYSVTREVGNAATSLSAISSATFTTAASGTTNPSEFIFDIRGNNLAVGGRFITYRGGYKSSSPNLVTINGCIYYANANPITKITIATFGVSAATLTYPMKLSTRSWNEP